MRLWVKVVACVALIVPMVVYAAVTRGTSAPPNPLGFIVAEYDGDGVDVVRGQLLTSLEPALPGSDGVSRLHLTALVAVADQSRDPVDGEEPPEFVAPDIVASWYIPDDYLISLGGGEDCAPAVEIERRLAWDELPESVRWVLLNGRTAAPTYGSDGTSSTPDASALTYSALRFDLSVIRGGSEAEDYYGDIDPAVDMGYVAICEAELDESWDRLDPGFRYWAPETFFVYPSDDDAADVGRSELFVPDNDRFYMTRAAGEHTRVGALAASAMETTASNVPDLDGADAAFYYSTLGRHYVRISSDGEERRVELEYLALGLVGGIIGSIIVAPLIRRRRGPDPNARPAAPAGPPPPQTPAWVPPVRPSGPPPHGAPSPGAARPQSPPPGGLPPQPMPPGSPSRPPPPVSPPQSPPPGAAHPPRRP